MWNVRTCRSDAKGEIASGLHREDQSTDAEHRGGATRSRAEGSVMELDRRGCVVQPRPWANWQQEEPMGEAKLFACLQWPNIVSGVKREFHAPFWEGLGVKFPRATRPKRKCVSLPTKDSYTPESHRKPERKF